MTQSIISRLARNRRDDSLTPETRAAKRYLRRYAKRLPEPQRAILLSQLAGKTPEQIAEEMKLEREIVCRWLARAYSHVRIALIRIESPPPADLQRRAPARAR